MERINAKRLKEMLDESTGPVVVNVLDPDDYRAKHIPETDNVPVSAPDFVDRVKARLQSRDEPVVVYCGSEKCDASERAAEKLEEAGFTKVIDYAAGIQGWEDAGYDFARG